MKKAGLVILFLTLNFAAVYKADAQIFFPGTEDSTTGKDGGDTAAIKQVLQDLKADNKAPAKTAPEDSTVKASETRVKLLELQTQRIKLEQELDELKRKRNPSPEEMAVINAKNQNLLLITEKERILLEQQLAEAKRLAQTEEVEKGKIYGQNFFRNKSFKQYEKTNEIVATEGYVIGSGDMLHLEVWGSRYWSKDYPVGESGAIDIAGYQRIYVKGLTLKQARALIGNRLGIGGPESSYSVTITRQRLVTVTVLGEVYRPGTYTLPATNSAFNVLVSMGGPTNLGSVRNIYIKRDGIIQDSFDVYEYFNNVTHPREVYLQNNDYILVTAARKVVEISGAVVRPGIYEAKESEKLSDLIQFAGGFMTNAYLQDVVINRFTGTTYETVSLNYDSLRKKGKDYNLEGVESISIKSILKERTLVASIEGSVSVKGLYKIKSGMRISGLIKTANGLSREAYLDKAYLIRDHGNNKREYLEFSPAKVLANPGGEEDLQIINGDDIHIFSIIEINKQYPISISGAVYKPMSKMAPVKGLRLGDMLFMAGGLLPEASDSIGYIIRGTSEFESEFISFIPKQVNSNPDFYNIEIKPGDAVNIHFKYESNLKFTLKCKGPVKIPYDGPFVENTRVTDIINMSGGLEPTANSTRALVFRENLKTGQKSTLTVNVDELIKDPGSPKNFILKRNDEVVLLNYSNTQNLFEIALFGAVKKPGSLSYYSGLTLQNAIDLSDGFYFYAAGSTIEIVRNFDYSNGNNKFFKPLIITVKIHPNLSIDSNYAGLVLQPFDKIFVRTNPLYVPLKTVELKGALYYPGTYALQLNNERVSSVVRRGGGLRPEASIKGATLRRLRAPGDTVSITLNLSKALHRRKSPYNYYLKEGDVISIPIAQNVIFISGDVNKYTTADIGTYYKPGKRAKYYIRNFGGGFTKTSDRRHVVVIRENGSRKGTRNYVVFKVYPKVRSGDKIVVASKLNNTAAAPKVNIDNVINKTLTRATALFSLLALYKLAINK